MRTLLRTIIAMFVIVFALPLDANGIGQMHYFNITQLYDDVLPFPKNIPRIPARPNETLDAVYDANTDLLHLTFKKDLGDVTISIKSFGEDIMSEQYNINTGDTYSLSLADYASGEYEIVISTAGGQSYVGWLVK